jgi:hypothetical protein
LDHELQVATSYERVAAGGAATYSKRSRMTVRSGRPSAASEVDLCPSTSARRARERGAGGLVTTSCARAQRTRS